jgi:hypothetical protein
MFGHQHAGGQGIFGFERWPSGWVRFRAHRT